MSKPTRIKLQARKHGYDVLCRIFAHDTPERDNTITRVTFRLNGEIQAEMLLGKYVSANPVVGAHFGKIDNGDEIFVSWQDIHGKIGQTLMVKR